MGNKSPLPRSAFEATRRFRPEAPFCFMSTNKVYGDAPNELPLVELEKRWDYARPEDRARAMYAGYDAVVAKPVDLDVLIDTIAHVAGVRGGGPDNEGATAEGP